MPHRLAFQIAGRGEARDVGRPRGSDGRAFGSPTRAHLGERSFTRGNAHPRCCGRHRRVMVEHAERKSLQHDGVGKCALDGENR